MTGIRLEPLATPFRCDSFTAATALNVPVRRMVSDLVPPCPPGDHGDYVPDIGSSVALQRPTRTTQVSAAGQG